MKLSEAIVQAVNTVDNIDRGKAIGGVADFMRFKLGLNYAESLAMSPWSGGVTCPYKTVSRPAGLMQQGVYPT